MRQLAEDLKTRVNLVAGQRLQPLRAKALHGKRSHHATIKQRPLQHFAVQFLLRREVAHESARKRITGSRWIFDFLDRQGRRAEWMMPNSESALAKENGRSVFP